MILTPAAADELGSAIACSKFLHRGVSIAFRTAMLFKGRLRTKSPRSKPNSSWVNNKDTEINFFSAWITHLIPALVLQSGEAGQEWGSPSALREGVGGVTHSLFPENVPQAHHTHASAYLEDVVCVFASHLNIREVLKPLCSTFGLFNSLSHTPAPPANVTFLKHAVFKDFTAVKANIYIFILQVQSKELLQR